MCHQFLRRRKMFSLLGNCYSNKKRAAQSRNVTLIILGFDNAGKTTTVRDLKGESKEDVTPSLGFSNISLKFGRLNITLFDVGGGPTIRGIWSSYYADVHGFIYVLDSTDLGRLNEVKNSLQKVMMEPTLKGKPCLILANKQDKEGALTEREIEQILDLESLATQSKCSCRLQVCSALNSGIGSTDLPNKPSKWNSKNKQSQIKDAFKWIVESVLDDWESLDERTSSDMKVAKEKADEERKAKTERIRKLKEEREKKVQEKEEKDSGATTTTATFAKDNNDRLTGAGEGASDAALSLSQDRMKQFAEVMQQVGNDLNNSLSESMRSNKSNLGRTPIFSTNFHSPNSNSSENGSNLELERNIGSSMNHPHSGRIENVFIVGENRYRERNLAGDNGLELQHKGADSQNHRQLPPLNDEAISKVKQQKKKKKVKKNQLEPFSPPEGDHKTPPNTSPFVEIQHKDKQQSEWSANNDHVELNSTTDQESISLSENMREVNTYKERKRDDERKFRTEIDDTISGQVTRLEEDTTWTSSDDKTKEKDVGKIVLENFHVTESDFYDSDFVSDTNNTEQQM